MNTLFFRLVTLILLVSLMSLNYAGSPIHTLIISRHAEKSLEGGLSPEGQERAKKLAKILRDVPLEQIYSTDYLRTKQTAAPTAKQHDLAITLYASNSALIKQIQNELSKPEATSILIIGHSNTVPQLIHALLGPSLPDIAETDFSNLFILQISQHNTQLLPLHYPS